jgi:hypothetical protein
MEPSQIATELQRLAEYELQRSLMLLQSGNATLEEVEKQRKRAMAASLAYLAAKAYAGLFGRD